MSVMVVRLVDRVLWHVGLKRLALNKSESGTLSYSQEGEDMLLKRIFSDKRDGFYVDVGAHHPVKYNNTYQLYLRGWHGVNIDAMPGSMNAFAQVRPRDLNIECGVAGREEELVFHSFENPTLNTFDEGLALRYVAMGCRKTGEKRIPVRPLARILSEVVGDDDEIDLMNVDVEGLELTVLQSNDWSRFRPKVMLVEDHARQVADALTGKTCRFCETVGYTLMGKLYNTLFLVENAFMGGLEDRL
jgi:FkbM family methyltransferase